jgi:hypothetical protein
MKAFIVVALLAVLAALASAGVFMLRRPRDASQPVDRRMARALALRVALSVGIFVLILVAWHFDWIAPRGLPTGR